jgi:hypothetical protein
MCIAVDTPIYVKNLISTFQVFFLYNKRAMPKKIIITKLSEHSETSKRQKCHKKMRFWSFLWRVAITCKSKDFELKLKLTSYPVDLFISRHVWLIWTCQLMFLRSRMHRVKVELFSLALQFSVTMWTKTFESLSTWRWIIPYLWVKSISIYMSHVVV